MKCLAAYLAPFSRKAPFAGQVDVINNHRVAGWVLDRGDSGRRVMVSIWMANAIIGETEASLPRPDLEAAKIGDGRHGFDFAFGQSVPDDALVKITAVVTGLSFRIPVSPTARQALKVAALPTIREFPNSNPRIPQFRSRFGGLWTDLSNAKEILAGRYKLGSVTDLEADLLATWIDDGYVTLRGAIDTELIEATLRDVDRAFGGELGLLFREITAPDGIRLVPVNQSYKSEKNIRDCKLIDMYVRSSAALRIALHESTVHFLNLIFDRPALVFQSLYFEYGSRQPGHQDTAYVALDSPMELAASWTALEDVRPGSGELFVYPGSHMIPEYLFEEKFKSQPTNSSEGKKFLEHLRQQAIASGLRQMKFNARAGDVLIWSGDLIHGGSEITNPAATRKSLVAHYCPVNVRPQYFNGECNIKELSARGQYTFAPRGY